MLGVKVLQAWAAPAALSFLVIASYAQFTSDYFQGGDTWPHIWTSQVHSFDQLLTVLSKPIMYGTVFPDTVALFFRPLSSLSYAFDFALWGLNPVAFHVTDLVIHLAATLALFALTQTLGLRRWPAAIGAATFCLHPVMASVVPDLPRRHDSLAGAGVFASLACATFAAKTPTFDARARLAVIAAAACLALGELAKESGYVGGLLVPLALICGVLVTKGRLRDAWPRIAAITLLLGVVSLAMFVWRYRVLGGIGGYYDQIPPLASLDIALTSVLGNMLWPFRELLGRTPRAWLTEIGSVLLVTGVPALLAPRRVRVALVFGWLLLVVSGLVQMLTKSVAAWQTYVTVGGFAFLIGGVLQLAYDTLLVRRVAQSSLRRVVTGACALGVLGLQVGILQQSVVFQRYTDWHIAGDVTREYLSAIRQCVDATPPGLHVMFNQYPDTLDDSTEQRRFLAPGMLGPYSVAPAVYLTEHAPPPVVNDSNGKMQIGATPRAITASCQVADGAWWVRTDYSY